MRALIFEPHTQGHRLNFVAEMAPALTDLGIDVTLSLAHDARDSAEFSTCLEPMLRSTRGVTVDAWMPTPERRMLGSAWTSGELLRQSILRARAGHVYVPSADGLAQMVGLARLMRRCRVTRHVQAEALLLRGAFAYPQPSPLEKLRHRLSWSLATYAPWARLYHLDPLVVDRAHRDCAGLSRRVSVMPDPVNLAPPTARAMARRALGIPEAGRYIGTAGLLDRRKGADLLIRAFAAAPLADDDRLLLVGRHAPEVLQLLRGEFAPLVARGRIVCIDRFAEGSEFLAALSAMDVVCTPYPSHIGSASIVLRGTAAGRMVLGSDRGWIGYVVPRFGLGRTVDVQNPLAFSAAIGAALNDSADFRLSAAADRFISFHSAANYRATWASGIRERLGLAPDPTLRRWEDVAGAR